MVIKNIYCLEVGRKYLVNEKIDEMNFMLVNIYVINDDLNCIFFFDMMKRFII